MNYQEFLDRTASGQILDPSLITPDEASLQKVEAIGQKRAAERQEKSPEDMTAEELEKKLGVVQA